MAFHPLPPLSFLCECFVYDAGTGEFFWKRRPDHHFQHPDHADNWNAQFAGSRTFSWDADEGYCRAEVRYQGRRYRLRAARVAFLMAYGLEPEMIDHINHQTDDDRLVNLRPATPRQNRWNQKDQGPRSRRLRGAFPSGPNWTSKIRHNGEHIRLGTFKTEIEAHRAYEATAKRLRGEFHPPA